MNRRSFFTKLGLAAASMAILPAATTYARHWVKPAGAALVTPVADLTTGMNFIPNPAWETAPYQMAFYYSPGAITVFNKNHPGRPIAYVSGVEEGKFDEGNTIRFAYEKHGILKVIPKLLPA